MHYILDVAQFHEKFGLKSPDQPTLLTDDLHQFRLKFLQEELDEYIHSCVHNDLGTAFDSLIDLVYVTCGTVLMHGYDKDLFATVLENYVQDHLFDDYFFADDEPFHDKPVFLSPAVNVKFTQVLQRGINLYSHSHLVDKDLTFIMNSLADIYFNAIDGAIAMGMPMVGWQEMWADVHRANMDKERVLKVEDSKRGSLWDVRKPKNWVPPKTQEILEKYL